MIAVLLGFGILAALSGRLWFEDKAGGIIGPDLIRTAGDNILLEANRTFYLLDRRGAVLRTVPFQSFSRFTGTADFQLLDADTVLVGDAHNKIILKCSLSAPRCGVLVDKLPVKIKSLFKFYFAERDRRLYLSDTGRHRIVILDLDSRRHKIIGKKLRYPNEILVKDELLYVADTNHHRVAVFDLAGDRPAESPLTLGVRNRLGRNSWPIAFVLGESGHPWVLVANGLLNNAELVEFSPGGEAIRKIGLPEGFKPSFIARAGSDIYLTSRDSFAVLKIDAGSGVAREFGDADFIQTLGVLKNRRDTYKTYSGAMMAMITLFALGMAVLVFVVARKRKKTAAANVQSTPDEAERPVYTGVVWLERNPKIMRVFKLTKWLMAVVAISLTGAAILALKADTGPLLIEDENLRHIYLIGGLLLMMMAALAWMANYAHQVRLGTDGSRIYFSAHKNHGLGISAPAELFVYTKYEIACPRFSIPVKNTRGDYIFEERDYKLHIQPLLADKGVKIGVLKMLAYQVSHFHPVAYFSLFVVALGAAILLYIQFAGVA